MTGARSKRYRAYRRAVGLYTKAAVTHMPPRPAGQTLNHIIPISRGFSIGMEAEDIGSIHNLEWTWAQENLQQGQRFTTHSIAVMRTLGRDDLADRYEDRIK